MFTNFHFRRVSWALVDQAVVSLGTFLVNIFFARNLPVAEYGTFALVFGLLLLLQVANTTLVFYPMTVRRAVPDVDQGDIVRSSIIMAVGLSVALSFVVLLAILLVFRRADLILPAILWFMAWQGQETMRRVLLSEFRYSSSIPGDAVSYLGQAALVAVLVYVDALTLPNAMYVLAATSAAAAVIQYLQLRIRWRYPYALRSTAMQFWSLGRVALANSAATALRVIGLVWLIALAVSRTDAAEFQAALNVVALVNPLLHGLCNIVPQTAAHAAAGQGLAQAWRAARVYMQVGAVPTFAYFAFVIASPGIVLMLFYGAGSPYLDAQFGLQLLAAASCANYLAEMIVSFLHGIQQPLRALQINLVGNVVVAVVAIPAIFAFGWTGACMALVIANAVRLLMGYHLVRVVSSSPKAICISKATVT